MEDCFESGVHTLPWVTTDTQRHRELKTPQAPLYLWEDIEFGALPLACTRDLSKRPQNKSESWQENFVLFAFTNKYFEVIKKAVKDDIPSYLVPGIYFEVLKDIISSGVVGC